MATENPAHHPTVLEATGARARLARIYAEALLAAASRDGQAETVGDELAVLVRDVLGGHPKIGEFFASRALSRKAKTPILQAAFASGTSDLVRHFVGVLNQNGRLDLLRAVSAAYQSLRDETAGRVRVRVTSAVPLSDAQTGELKQTLADRLKAEPILDTRTDPDLLGGLVVRVGDRVYDTSVRTRLHNLRNHLMASGTHGNA
jgi:F-type H+-transporting ATPase subunit delta